MNESKKVKKNNTPEHIKSNLRVCVCVCVCFIYATKHTKRGKFHIQYTYICFSSFRSQPLLFRVCSLLLFLASLYFLPSSSSSPFLSFILSYAYKSYKPARPKHPTFF